MRNIHQIYASEDLFHGTDLRTSGGSVCIKRGMVGKHALRICRDAYVYQGVPVIQTVIDVQSQSKKLKAFSLINTS